MISSADPWADDGFSDPDTCRICRGEGTTDEPLFYPCKCSGSIKYVHQNCLMEWLSHSQKKHCELCKTPFRFTKLYSPDMPQRLPFHIFIHHMTRYLFRNVLVWLRAALVTSVWLGWLPYLMRSVWSFLFWVSDEGLYVPMDPGGTRNVSWLQGSNTLSVSVTGTTICPSTPLLPVTTTAASIGAAVDQVAMSNLMRAMTAPFNNSGTTNSWLRTLFGLPAQNPVYNVELVGNMNVTLRNLVTKTTGSDSRSSLLGNVGFLHRITRSPALNRIIISVLEGQVITVFVIICFILIILVRDYVVQQQPEINMRAAFAAVEDAENDMAQLVPAANIPVPNPEPAPAPDPFRNDGDGDEDDEEDSDSDESEQEYRRVGDHNEYEGLPDVVRGSPAHPRRLAPMRTRSYNMPNQGDGSSDSSSASGSSQMANSARRNENESESLHGESSVTGGEPGPVQTTISEYARIYREAEGDIDRIQDIIETSGLVEALSPVSSLVAENAGSDSSSWTWAGTDDGVDSTAGFSNKGKGRAEASDHNQGASSSPSTTMPVSRPRAVSDGPQASLAVNPLANNNWSFQHLPSPQSLDDSTYQDDNPESRHQPESPVMSSDTFNTPPHQASPFIIPARLQGVQVTPENSADMNELPPADVNPLQPDPVEDEGVMDEPAAPVVAAEARRAVVPPQHPNTIVDRVADFMWGDVPVPVDADGANQEEAVDIFGDNQNPPFMHGGHGGRNDDNGPEQEAQMAADVVEAAAAAGLDPEAVEDAEDFDGIMELIGMRGPITGLFQNAIFCAFLVSISIFVGIFVPYNVGRLAAWILANPTRLVQMMFSSAKLVQDGVLLAVGYTSTFMFNIFEACRLLLGITQGKQILRTLRLDARQLSNGALDRIIASIRSEIPAPSVSDVTHFSAVRHLSAASHQALLVLKGNLRYCVLTSGHALLYIFGGDYLAKWAAAREFWKASWPALVSFLEDLPHAGARLGTRATNFNSLEPSIPLDMGLAHWSAYDRTWAILLGYASITLLAALYLARGTTLSTGQTAQEWEASIIDGLNQASGVMKVILIISIEMLVFPLYCGLLLDFALLPLFENTTLASRLAFACNHPFTSIFVHWFIGTGYMFHFALFVSMCRKIMRKGVLCSYPLQSLVFPVLLLFVR
jgi:E3 ubiquitin-protein ligase MARCH6